MAELTRRRLLTAAAAAAGAGVASTLLPLNVRKALAAEPPRRSSLRDIEHVVLLMQENRSFDHYFGTMDGVRGFADPHALKLPTGRSVFYQPDAVNPDGYLLPFHLDTKKSSAQAIPSTSHAWAVQHQAWNNGSVFGPTWPNRLYWMTGTVDPGGTLGGPITYNGTPNGPYRWTTYAERLQAAGVSWKVYQEADNYGTNMLAEFTQFQAAQPGDPLYDNAMVAQPAGTFEDDARNDRLPAVSWILPTSYQSEHPDYLPAAGADYVASKIEAIAANPKLWKKTAFILNYDENDGLFDHVAPPVPKAGTKDEFIGGLPIGGGFRVPAIVISPWTAGGWVASEHFDHTLVLQFLEKFTGVHEPNITDWRRRTFGDLTSAFRFHDVRTRFPRLPDTAKELAAAQWEVANLPAPTLPGAGQIPPHQKPGHRPHI